MIIYSIIDLDSVQYRKTDDIQNDNSNYPSEKRLCGTNFAHLLRRFAPLSNIICLSQIHTTSHGTAFEACAAQLLRMKRLGFRFLDVSSGECTPPFPRRRGQRGDGGVQWPEAFNVRRESLPSRSLSPLPCGRDKKRGRA